MLMLTARAPLSFNLQAVARLGGENVTSKWNGLSTFPLRSESHLYLLLSSSDFLVLSQGDRVILASVQSGL